MKTRSERASRDFPRDLVRSPRPIAAAAGIKVTGNSTPRTPIHVHEIFLNCCRKEYANVEIVTTSGEIIDGFIDGYDKDTIVVHNDMTQLLIYKHSINYISPRNGKRLIVSEREMSRLSEGESIVINEKKD